MLQDVSWSPGLVSALIAACLAVAVLLWLLLRQQKKKSLLPILGVVQLQLKTVPRLRWTRPPLWPFLCFLLAGLTLGLFSLEPTESILKSENLDLRYTHVVFDLSPSMALSSTPETYLPAAEALLDQLSGKARLSYSLSHDGEIHAADQREPLRSGIQKGYHRPGFKLGVAVETLLAKAPDIEHIVVFSDSDRGAWDDFNWSYLEKKIQVSWYPMQSEIARSANFFIDDVKPPRSGAGDRTWTVILRRSAPGDALSGTLSASYQNQKLMEQTWRFEGEMSSVELELSLPEFKVDDKAEPVLVWTLGSAGPQDLPFDNEFRSYLNPRDRRALLVAQPRGEMFLEDSFFHVKTSLEILGFETDRTDRYQEGRGQGAQLVLAEAKPSQPRSVFCPNPNRLPQETRQVWLVPSEELKDFDELCSCAAGFIQAPAVLNEKPAYCQDIETRDQYVGVLQSLGAKQLGGDTNSPLGAIAMQFLNKSDGRRLIAFTIPLSPNAERGVSFGRLPLLLKTLFDIAPLEADAQGFGRWPRLESITGLTDPGVISLSNVPFIESSLQTLPEARLPPKLGFGERGMVRQSALANREKDSRPWIYVCLSLLAAAFWLEAIGQVLGRIFRGRAWAERWFGLFLAAVLFSGAGAEKASAQVVLNLLGYSKVPNFTPIKREVVGRTSIDLSETPKVSASFGPEPLKEPWLWVAQPEVLASLSPLEKSQLIAWIRRGGFLVVERARAADTLAKEIQSSLPQGAWKPIPPDHELMRSFHLLPSLPLCGEQGWSGFHFDQRLAVLMVPGELLDALNPAGRAAGDCMALMTSEQASKIFINILMVVLTTDYKNDQVHLPEILKRLR